MPCHLAVTGLGAILGGAAPKVAIFSLLPDALEHGGSPSGAKHVQSRTRIEYFDAISAGDKGSPIAQAEALVR